MKNLRTAASQIVNSLKFFGFIPIFTEKRGSFANLINITFLIVALIFWTINLILRLNAISAFPNEQVLSILGLKLRIILPYVFVILLIFGSLVGQKKVLSIIDGFDEFDEKVKLF